MTKNSGARFKDQAYRFYPLTIYRAGNHPKNIQPYTNFLLNHLHVTAYPQASSPSQTKYTVQIPKIRLLTQIISQTAVL